MEFIGKTALVTGATGGIGSEIAVALAGRGMNLALVAQKVEPLDKLAEEIRAAGCEAIALPSDIRVEAEVQAAVNATLQ